MKRRLVEAIRPVSEERALFLARDHSLPSRMMPRDAWSLDELFAELRRFEAELRAEDLREYTVSTYVGRAKTFLRWLGGRYESRGPNVQPEPRSDIRGQQLLVELRDQASRVDLAIALRTYAAITGYDSSLAALRVATTGAVDLTVPAHRDALLVWLRAWGCRHLRRTDNERSSRVLANWWLEHSEALPSLAVDLTSLEVSQLDHAARAHSALAQTPAAGRTVRAQDLDVVFGTTAAAKTLFALRPNAFPPWDEPIRLSFGWRSHDESHYRHYLELVADALLGLAWRLQASVSELPGLLGLPSSTPAKLVDEYLRMRITREP
jgi:hypothetical protein